MNFPQGTFFLFQHFPGIEFKKLGVPGTVMRAAGRDEADEGEGLRYLGQESTTPLTLIKPKRKERTCRFFSGYLEYRSR
jgi:hypothetical protein